MVEQAVQYASVERACSALVVSPSGYYAWQRRKTSPCRRRQADLRLLQQIRRLDALHHSRYGSLRIHAALRQSGEQVSKHRVARLMREAGIQAKRTHRRRSTTVVDHQAKYAANLLDRNFAATAPNQKWVADVTYVPTEQGWLYLAVVLDLYSRKVVGWATSPSFNEALVCQALQEALATRPAPALHHSDRGVQYTSLSYQRLLAEHGIETSMSRTGEPYDNAVMESFFASLKEEHLHSMRFVTFQQAESALLRYVEGYYNRTRLHSTLNYLTPDAYEAAYWRQQPAVTTTTQQQRQHNSQSPETTAPGDILA